MGLTFPEKGNSVATAPHLITGNNYREQLPGTITGNNYREQLNVESQPPGKNDNR
jgi:hypothetical protein